ncbi:ATP-binding cassette, subfamily C [Streptococcus equinus]|uniref:ATP-binding cassette, subfamily C n=1 Tax=Streptococcus equinus TaxID=1335 RepID=A0A1H0KSG8_STREI|nr:ABC transporter ATP-binding protein [Streptococcus equinus]SDO58726.1 ATP-binding cassette, subfamily C [Streptococcus equinus]
MSHKTLSTKQVVKRLAELVKGFWLEYVLAVGGAVLGFFMTILIPSLVIHLAWQALVGRTPQFRFVMILFTLGLLRGILRYVEHYFGHYVAFKTLYDFRCMVFAKLRRLAPAKLDHQDSGNMLKMIGEDIEAMEVFFAHTLPPVITASLVTIILEIYYWSVSPLIALISLTVYAVLAIFLPRLQAKHLQPLLQEQTKTRCAYMSHFSDSLHGMKDLLQFGQVKSYLKQLNKESKSVNACEKEVAQTQHLQASLSFFIIGFAMMLVVVLAVSQANNGQISLLSATTIIVVFSASFAPYLELSRLPLGFKRAMTAARQVFALLDEEENDKSGLAFNETITHIALEDVSFSYKQRNQNIFEQLSVVFENHKVIGLVGKSGSGKSTLMKLVMKWYDNTKGQILINQRPLSTLAARDVQNRIAYIPQIPQIFSQNIRENLRLGNPNITDEMILEAADKCRIKDKILTTTDGLDTELNNEQTIFSAGELQRLELTRALLKNADCYIFDEPTSNLDSLNEAAFLKVIREHCKGYVFLISHRLSTVASCDIIYRIENGRITQL